MKKYNYRYFSSHPNLDDWAYCGTFGDMEVFKSVYSDDLGSTFKFGVTHEADEDGCPFGLISDVDIYSAEDNPGASYVISTIDEGTIDIYKYFISLGYKILGNEIQYYNERILWSELSKDATLRVDIIDLVSNTTIEENAIIHQGIEDEDFDKRVWSYTTEMKDIRLILTDIK